MFVPGAGRDLGCVLWHISWSLASDVYQVVPSLCMCGIQQWAVCWMWPDQSKVDWGSSSWAGGAPHLKVASAPLASSGPSPTLKRGPNKATPLTCSEAITAPPP